MSLFVKVESGDIQEEELQESIEKEIELFLPHLLICYEDTQFQIDGIRKVSQVMEYIEIDDEQLLKEINQELNVKRSSERKEFSIEGSLISQLDLQLGLEFEKAIPYQRLRLVLSEIFNLVDVSKFKEPNYYSDLFDNSTFLEELSIIIPIIFHKFSSLLTVDIFLQVLLRVQLGPPLLRVLVANSPEIFHQVVEDMVHFFRSQPDFIKMKISETLLSLCSLAPHHSFFVRNLLLRNQILPHLMLQLTLLHCQDEILFLNLLFEASPDWIRSDSMIHQLLYSIRQKIVNSITQNPTLMSYNSCALLRLYCGFVGYLNLKLEQSEIQLVLQIIQTSQNHRGIKLAICFLLLCQDDVLLGRDQVLNCFLNVKERAMKGNREIESDSEMLLLLALNFQTQQAIVKVNSLLIQALNIKVKMPEENFAVMKELFTKEIFPTKTLCEFVLSLNPTKNLSAETNSLPVTCIYGLIHARLFNENFVELKNWILKQIFETTQSIHYLLPALLQEYTKSLIESNQNSAIKISEIELLKAFSFDNGNEKILPSHVLLAFYVLSFNSYVQAHQMKYSISIPEYSNEVLDQIPFKKIIKLIEKNENYVNIYPLMFSLTSSLLSHLFSTQSSLLHEESITQQSDRASELDKKASSFDHLSTLLKIRRENFSISPFPSTEEIQNLIKESEEIPANGLLILNWLRNLPVDKLEEYTEPLLSASISLILDSRSEGKISRLFGDIWEILCVAIPQKVRIATINLLVNYHNVMRGNSNENSQSSEYRSSFSFSTEINHADLVNDPMIILKCHPGVFTSPTLYNIVIQILGAYMLASRQKAQLEYKANYAINKTVGIKQDDLASLLFTQESLIVQLVIETCSETTVLNHTSKGTLNEIRIIACSFLHQIFIENTLLMKLVHFQGYQKELIPVLVEGVPSMHICLDFIPELLANPATEKQSFAICLASKIAEKYPIPRSLEIVIMCLSKIRNSRQKRDSKEFFINCLPSLISMCNAFPHLAEDVCEILYDIKQMEGRRHSQPDFKSDSHLDAKLQAQVDQVFQTLVSTVILKGLSQSQTR